VTPNAGPLSGVRVLVGRARHQASTLSAGLRTIGAEAIEIPFIEIRKPRSYKAFDAALKHIAEYDWLILTSVNGVEALASRMKALRIAATTLKDLKIAAIGPATGSEVEKLGLAVAVVPKRYVAESVVESLRGKVKGKRVLLARARVARDVIPGELRNMGAQVDIVEAYETVVPKSSKARLHSVMKDPKRRPHVITFTSSSSVRNFVQLLGGREHPPHTSPPHTSPPHTSPPHTGSSHTVFEGIKFASIGPVTSATLRELGLPVHIEAEEYTIPGLIRAVVSEAVQRRLQ
jgi:uroporphyrinogen-III synthase